MKIGVLTSSRADYGIYRPLLLKLRDDNFFSLEIIAFGTHLSKQHGYTVNHIYDDKYTTVHTIQSLLDDDNEASISESYGLTAIKFSSFWKDHNYNLVFCLGDRFEMSAAVQASIPFNINLAHIHGGETTLGAIDNVYRHQITLASKIHFTSTLNYKSKVIELLGKDDKIYNVGALSLDNINEFEAVSKEDFFNTFKIKNSPFLLCTFHPETITPIKNTTYAEEMRVALSALCKSINIVVTMPNADTQGSVYRKALYKLKEDNENSIYLIENFGKQYYFSAMNYCDLLIGNTSSGIIEAASFNKFVVNVGDRQKGRAQSKNILNSNFENKDIIKKTKEALAKGKFKEDNVYYKSQPSKTIIDTLKMLNDKL